MEAKEDKSVLTAVQPTNKLTLGNYLGAIKNFQTIKEKYSETSIFVADLHAITVRQENPKELAENTLKTIATYLACGIDYKTTSLFVQSHLPQHTELAWILNCHSYMGELSRMHQFREKSVKQGQNIIVGLHDYPVLMAADILLHDTNFVPVGEDQKQHLELTRDIANRMNSLYGEDTFVVPDGIQVESGSKIMSLQNPTKKMSKSDEVAGATVFLDDSDEEIIKKFKRAITDSGSEVTNDETKLGIMNLIEIQAAVLNKPIKEVLNSYLGKQYGVLKKETGEIVVELIAPIREETNNLLKNHRFLKNVVEDGVDEVYYKARNTLKRVKERVGFLI
jgi:tryptophanyl-tRNA synthetase